MYRIRIICLMVGTFDKTSAHDEFKIKELMLY